MSSPDQADARFLFLGPGPVRFDHIRAVTLDALHRLSTALETETIADKLTSLDRQVADLTRKTGGTPAPPPNYDNLTEEKGDRLVKAREARIALLTKKVAEQAGAEDDKRRREEEEDLAALEEQDNEGDEEGGIVTNFVEEDDDEEAEAEAAMAAFMADRAKAKAAAGTT